MYLAVRWRPELVHSLFDPRQLAQFESMYDPAAAGAKLGRDSGSDLQMFGLYIANNISIGFRTFAGGLLAGVGSLPVLVFNGVMFGPVAAHRQGIGDGRSEERRVGQECVSTCSSRCSPYNTKKQQK